MNATAISNAALEAIDLIEKGGERPKAAITKVACAHNLTADQTTRVCQLYNRAQQLNSRVGAEVEANKFAAVAGVVDPTDVLNAVAARRGQTHVNTKTAALSSLSAVSLLDSRSERYIPKVATAPSEPVKQSQQLDRCRGLFHGLSYGGAIEILNSNANKLAALYAEIRDMVGSVQSACSNAIHTAVDLALKSDDREGFVKQACFVIGDKAPRAGGAVAVYADRLLDVLPKYKVASFAIEPTYAPQTYMSGIQEVMKQASIVAELYDLLRVGLPPKVASCAQIRETCSLLRSCMDTDGVYNRSIMLLPTTTLADTQSEHISKVGSFFASFVGNRLAGKPVNGDPAGANKEQERFKLKIGNPQHEAALLSIRSRAALQQLMVDDPVISAEDPNVVASAFNELAAYTPEAMQTPAVLRSALRQYLMNNTSAADLSAIRGLERPQPKQMTA